MRRTILWHAVTGLVLSGLVTLSSGCRKELCYNHDEHAYSVKVDVTATWEREWERDQAVEFVEEFLATDFEGGRHQRRIEKIPVKACSRQ